MDTLIIFNHQPYDGSDIAWNALRLAKTLREMDEEGLNEKNGCIKT